MNRATFFQKFELLAGTPDAVAKMRDLVLHIAFAGALVENPSSWTSKRLCEVTSKIGSGATPAGGRASYATKGVPLIRSMNVHFHGFVADGLAYLNDEQAAELANVEVRSGDVLLNITGASIGRVTVAPAQMKGARVNQHVAIIRPSDELSPRFLAMYLASPAMQSTIDGIQVGATREALTKRMIEQFEVPLPPLAEQKRIVAKVDELMALCDQLEAQQQERETKHAALARASLARFSEAPAPANLNLLFHKSCTIDPAELRKAILDLAVKGELVRQDPADRMTRLHVKTRLDMSALPKLPKTWAWNRVDETGRVDLGRQRAPQHHIGPHMRPYLRVQNVYEARLDLSDVKEMNFSPTEFETFALKAGDVLLNEGQSRELVGRPAIYRGEVPGACFQNTLIRYRPSANVLSEYALVVFRANMRSGRFQKISKQTTNIAHLSAGRFAAMEFPLPPLPEQRRIVAKVDELMKLVDQLEQQLSRSRELGEKLLEAVVAELTDSSTGTIDSTRLAAEDAAGYGSRKGRDLQRAATPR